MTYFLLYLLLWIWDNRSFDTISRLNRDKSEAETAYLEADYQLAARLYEKITYGSLFTEPASRLYLAHSYFHLDSLQKARYQYQLLQDIDDRTVASRANTQLAILSARDADTARALDYLTIALRIEPSNDKARFDYELLKKTFSGKSGPPPPDKTLPDELPPPTPPTPPAQQEVEIARQREELLQSLRRMHMSEAQARAILDAMKTNESQYIYQLRRRQYYDQSERSNIIEW